LPDRPGLLTFDRAGLVRTGIGFAAVIAIALALLLTVVSCRQGGPVPEVRQAEAERMARQQLVTSAHPLASEAGREVLRSGGNAMDAAVAVQMMLAFVEPPESGLGGGAFLLYRDGETRQVEVFDGRETAPGAAVEDRFLGPFGTRRPLALAVVSGDSVGVPGLVAMLHRAHAEHGRRDWEDLLAPAIRAAEEGIEYPARLAAQVRRDRSLRLFGDLRRTFVTPSRHDTPRLVNPELAETLRLLAEKGPEPFYTGEIAKDIVDAVAARRPWPGDMDLDDLAAYRPVVREAVCASYHKWEICGPPPPSSGAVTVLQTLGMLEHFDLAGLQPDSVEAIHLIAEASRLAFADRFLYLGDPDHVGVPVEALLDPDYLAARARLIDPDRVMDQALPGLPGIAPILEDAPEVDEEETTGTTHFSILDSTGNMVSMTSSIEAPFGSRIMTRGFLLNNQLTDFSFRPRHEGFDLANRVGPGKRPRSSMSPTIVTGPDGSVRLVIGSRGGARIIGHVIRVLVATLDWEIPLQEAVARPNHVHRGEYLELERGTGLADHRRALRSMGHKVRMREMASGLNGFESRGTVWHGSADPRLDAEVRTD